MNRGADRQDVFVHDADYQIFERLMGEAIPVSGVEVHAYCLMSNHFHLLLRCRLARLSEAMHLLEGRYARWFNDRYARDGPMFRGRFTSVLVESDEQLLTVWRYIHRNPLAIVPAAALAAYRWSSLGPYLGRRPGAQWLVTDEMSATLGGDAERIREFVETDLPSDLLRAGGRSSAHSITPERIDEVAAEVTGVARASIATSSQGASNLARMLAISLCVELRAAPTDDLAARYGVAPSSVRTTARRGRILASSDEHFSELRLRVLARLHSSV